MPFWNLDSAIKKACKMDKSWIHEGQMIDYFGFVKRVVELTFLHGYKVILFQCEWYNTGSMSTMKCDKYFLSIDVRSRWYKDEPFVLPNQVQQVFYIPDMKLGENWRIVQHVQHRHLWNIPELDSNNVPLADNEDEVLLSGDAFQQHESREVMSVAEDDDMGILNRENAETFARNDQFQGAEDIEDEIEFDNVFQNDSDGEDGTSFQSSETEHNNEMDIDMESE